MTIIQAGKFEHYWIGESKPLDQRTPYSTRNGWVILPSTYQGRAKGKRFEWCQEFLLTKSTDNPDSEPGPTAEDYTACMHAVRQIIPEYRPILFSAPMVRAILDGRKTQTRRVCADQPSEWCRKIEYVDGSWWGFDLTGQSALVKQCPYGEIGDRLWVRETFRMPRAHNEPEYAADLTALEVLEMSQRYSKTPYGWKPSIHMPRNASRITLEITDIRVERLQQITEADAISEGFTPENIDTGVQMSAVSIFSDLWNKLNAERGFGWEVNPWVWVIEFKRITA